MWLNFRFVLKNWHIISANLLVSFIFLLSNFSIAFVGSFFSEAAWYEVSEAILTRTKELCYKLPENYVSTYLIQLECFQRSVPVAVIYPRS